MADPNNPWGRKPSGGGNSGGGMGGGKPPIGGGPNPFEKIIRDSQDKLREAINKNNGPEGEGYSAFAIGFVVLTMLWLATGIYRVNSDELGVVLRFGQYSRTTAPGLNYRLPMPMEQVIIPSVTTVNTVEIGNRAGAANNPGIRVAKYSSAMDSASATTMEQTEGLMLTGDRNIVDIDFTVQWKIDAGAPEKFLFNMRNPEGNAY